MNHGKQRNARERKLQPGTDESMPDADSAAGVNETEDVELETPSDAHAGVEQIELTPSAGIEQSGVKPSADIEQAGARPPDEIDPGGDSKTEF